MSVSPQPARSDPDPGPDVAFAALLEHLAVLLAREHVSWGQADPPVQAPDRRSSGEEGL